MEQSWKSMENSHSMFKFYWLQKQQQAKENRKYIENTQLHEEHETNQLQEEHYVMKSQTREVEVWLLLEQKKASEKRLSKIWRSTG